MMSPRYLSKGLALAILLAAATLAGCVTSQDPLFNAAAAPAKAGRYEVQYLVDGKWTKFSTGSLKLGNRTYSWAEDREASSLLNAGPRELRFQLVAMGGTDFMIAVASADLRASMWTGNYIYGIARRANGAFLYDFPSCLDLLVSQGLSDFRIQNVGAHECHYSSKASLTDALTRYAKHTAMWKRLVPSSR